MYVYILHALYVQVAGFLTVNRNYILFVVLWCVTYLHVNMKKKNYSKCNYVCSKYKICINCLSGLFQLPSADSKHSEHSCDGCSCCFCQSLEVVTQWAVCWEIVHLMPCNCLSHVSFIRTSFCSVLSLISTFSSGVSHFLNFLTASTMVRILRVDFQVNWQLSLVSPAPLQT